MQEKTLWRLSVSTGVGMRVYAGLSICGNMINKFLCFMRDPFVMLECMLCSLDLSQEGKERAAGVVRHYHKSGSISYQR